MNKIEAISFMKKILLNINKDKLSSTEKFKLLEVYGQEVIKSAMSLDMLTTLSEADKLIPLEEFADITVSVFPDLFVRFDKYIKPK